MRDADPPRDTLANVSRRLSTRAAIVAGIWLMLSLALAIQSTVEGRRLGGQAHFWRALGLELCCWMLWALEPRRIPWLTATGI